MAIQFGHKDLAPAILDCASPLALCSPLGVGTHSKAAEGRRTPKTLRAPSSLQPIDRFLHMIAFRDPIFQALSMFSQHFGRDLLREVWVRQLLLYLCDLGDVFLQFLR